MAVSNRDKPICVHYSIIVIVIEKSIRISYFVECMNLWEDVFFNAKRAKILKEKNICTHVGISAPYLTTFAFYS